MGIKDTVENHPVIWTLATAIAAFVAGFGAYEAILKISRNQIVSADAHVLSSDEKAMPREEYNRLLAASTQLVTAIGDNEALTKLVAQYESQQEFLIRYLRYETARQLFDDQRSAESESSLKLAEKMFVELILRWWKNQQDLDGNLVLNQQVIRKGLDPTNSRVEFADGTAWPIPTEIKLEVLQRE